MTATRLSVDAAFVAMLRAGIPKTVYYADSADPESGEPPANAEVPYVVVYAIGGGDLDGPPLTDPEADGQYLYQTTCVGGTASQAVGLDDWVREVVVGRTPTGAFVTDLVISGMVVVDRATTDGTSGAIQTGRLWQTNPRYGIRVTPA